MQSLVIEICFALLAGVCLGTFTGLIPGIHVNLISLLALQMSPLLLLYTSPIIIAAGIIAMGVTHSFLDFIPSVFLGAPDADTALSVLPGHKLLLEGKAYDAVYLTTIGSLASLFICVIFAAALVPFMLILYPLIRSAIPYLLIVIVAYMIFKDRSWFWNMLVFLLSGVLGLIVLSMPGMKFPLFGLLSGLFGVSLLVTSLSQKVSIPRQKKSVTISVSKKEVLKSSAAASIVGTCTAFFPGLGPAQGAVLASQFLRNMRDYAFLLLVGGINTVNFVVSLVTLYALDKARNGAVLVVSSFMPAFDVQALVILLCVSLIGGCIAAVLTMRVTGWFSNSITKVSYMHLSLLIICLITFLVFYWDGFLGLGVLIVATVIGILPQELGIAKNHAMGCLLLPVILFLL